MSLGSVGYYDLMAFFILSRKFVVEIHGLQTAITQQYLSGKPISEMDFFGASGPNSDRPPETFSTQKYNVTIIWLISTGVHQLIGWGRVGLVQSTHIATFYLSG